MYQKGERLTLPAFRIARYPVTNAQYRCFLDDPEGYAADGWWDGLGTPDRTPAPPEWDYANHPRETVSWYEAVAFCRWLSRRLARVKKLTCCPTSRNAMPIFSQLAAR